MYMESINLYSLKLVREKEVLYASHQIIRSPQDIYLMLENILKLSECANEVFGIICLTTKNAVAGIHVISIGILNSAIVHPREVFKAAISNNAASIICFHCHPSGDPTESSEDIAMTRRLLDSGIILGIDVLDHIIVGDGRFVSLQEKGLM